MQTTRRLLLLLAAHLALTLALAQQLSPQSSQSAGLSGFDQPPVGGADAQLPPADASVPNLTFPPAQEMGSGGQQDPANPQKVDPTVRAPSGNQPSGQWHLGLATITATRDVSNTGAVNFACGMGYLNDYFKDHFVGFPAAYFGSGQLCGSCLWVRCAFQGCPSGSDVENGTHFMVVDSCQDCKGNDAIMSVPGYGNLTGLNYDLYPSAAVEWQLTSCAPLIDGTIRMLPSKQNTRYYLGLNFSNTRQLVHAVRINGRALKAMPHGLWEIDSPGVSIFGKEPGQLRPPYTLQLLGETREVLTVQLQALQPTVLDVQFSMPPGMSD